jgi:hypothetical protein
MTREQIYALLTEIAANAAARLDAAGVATDGVIIALGLGDKIAIAGGVPKGEHQADRVSQFGSEAARTIGKWADDTATDIRRAQGGVRGIVH